VVTYSDMEWWERGACRAMDFPQIFERQDQRVGRPRRFGQRPPSQNWQSAKELCASCPVTKECLEFTLNSPAPIGREPMFVAGYTPDQIAILRIQWNKRKRGTR
jgi:hypothetical protein